MGETIATSLQQEYEQNGLILHYLYYIFEISSLCHLLAGEIEIVINTLRLIYRSVMNAEQSRCI